MANREKILERMKQQRKALEGGVVLVFVLVLVCWCWCWCVCVGVLVLACMCLCLCVGVRVRVFVCLWRVVFDIVVIVFSIWRRPGYCVVLFTAGTRAQHN